MGTKEIVTGNYAQSFAAKLARVQVISAYPITPQTTIVEKLAEFVSEGELDADFIKVESEHSALQACLSASAVGARTYTATSSQGLLLMHELLFWAAGQRAPVVMGVVNRAVAPPWSIWTDHTDTMAQRDTGWIQVYCESNQEVLDTTLMAFRFAERDDVRLPAMVTEDAFYLSHTVEAVDIPEQREVDDFLPPRPRTPVLEIGKTGRLGSFMGPDLYMEFRYSLAEAMAQARRAILDVEADFERHFRRSYPRVVELYKADGAAAAPVTLGAAPPPPSSRWLPRRRPPRGRRGRRSGSRSCGCSARSPPRRCARSRASRTGSACWTGATASTTAGPRTSWSWGAWRGARGSPCSGTSSEASEGGTSRRP